MKRKNLYINKKSEKLKENNMNIKEKNKYMKEKNEEIKEKNLYINEKNKEIEEKNEGINEKLNKLIKENKDLNVKNEDLNIKNNFLNKENKDLKEKLNRYPFIIEKGEALISIIISSRDEKILYSIPCKNTNTINDIEKELYEVFPEYSNTKNIFLYKGQIITNKFETLQKNKIKNGEILILDRVDN